MKWGCSSATLWPSTFESQGNRLGLNGRYLGHTIERGMGIIDEESRTPWVGWRCQWCGERFQLPGEAPRYYLPLMEDVETEELPTDDREAAALLLAMCASTPGDINPVDDALGELRDEVVDLAMTSFSSVRVGMFRRMSDVLPDDRSILTYALAEALIRTGEVKP